MTSALVSVLLTAYNREEYVAASIESVLAQSCGDFELIVTDDRSSDGTLSIAREYERKDPRVRVHANERNLGDYGNRNYAASLARGEFLKFHDSDDIMYPHCLEVMVRYLSATPSAAFALSAHRAWGGAPCPIISTPHLSYQREFLGFGMFNALVMSYSRLPLAMAQDGMLPKVFGKLHPRSRAPWVTILVCATGWAMCLGLGFERLIIIDILLYGASLSLEFVALIVLRIREPELPRPFRVPGGMFGAVAVGIAPMLLLGFSVLRSQSEQVLGISAFAFGMLLIAAGAVAYFLNVTLKPSGWSTAPDKPEPVA